MFHAGVRSVDTVRTADTTLMELVDGKVKGKAPHCYDEAMLSAITDFEMAFGDSEASVSTGARYIKGT